MRKFKVILILLLTFFIIYFLQLNFFSWFNIGGIMPNLIIVLTLFIGLFIGNKTGAIFGIIFGIIIDLNLGKTIGITSVLLAIIGLLGEYMDKNFSKDSRVTIIVMSALSTIIYEVFTYAINIFQYGGVPEILTFTLTLLVEILFNTMLIIIFYPLMKKLGYYLEEQYKGKKILTRYF